MGAHLDQHRCGKYSQHRDERSNQPLIDPVKHSVGELERTVRVSEGGGGGGDGGVGTLRGPLAHLSALPEDLLVVRVVSQGVETDTSHHQTAQTGPEQEDTDRSLPRAPGEEEQ